MTGAASWGCRCRADGQQAAQGAGGAQFRVLGPVEASVGDVPVPVSGPRQRAVLAALVLGAGRVVSAERLERAVWDGAPPPTGRLQIQAAISRLRGGLPGLIRTRGTGYLLAACPCQVDALLFRRLACTGRAAMRNGHCAEAAPVLRAAQDLWRGSALDGVSGLAAEAIALEELRVVTAESLFAAELGTGRHASVVADLYACVTERPWRESFRGLLMLALYRSGRKVDALTVYHDGRQENGRRQGGGPGPTLQWLRRTVSRDDPCLDSPSAVVTLLS